MYQPSVGEQIGAGGVGGGVEPCASFSEIRQKDLKATEKTNIGKYQA